MTLAERIEHVIDTEKDKSTKIDLCTAWLASVQVEIESINYKKTSYEEALAKLNEIKASLKSEA